MGTNAEDWLNHFEDEVQCSNLEMLQIYLSIDTNIRRQRLWDGLQVLQCPEDPFCLTGIPLMPCGLCYDRAEDSYSSIIQIGKLNFTFHDLRGINIQPYVRRDQVLWPNEENWDKRFIRCVLTLHLCCNCRIKCPERFVPLSTYACPELEALPYETRRLFSLIQPFTRMKQVGISGVAATQSVFFGEMDYTGWEQLHKFIDTDMDKIHTSIFFNQWSLFPHWSSSVRLQEIRSGFEQLARINTSMATFLRDKSKFSFGEFFNEVDSHNSVDVVISRNDSPDISISKTSSAYISVSEGQSTNSGSPLYEVEALLEYDLKQGHPCFKVKWKGFNQRQATWHRVWDLLNDGLAPLVDRFIWTWNQAHPSVPFRVDKSQLLSIVTHIMQGNGRSWRVIWKDGVDIEPSWILEDQIPFTTHNAHLLSEYMKLHGLVTPKVGYTTMCGYEFRSGSPHMLAQWQLDDDIYQHWRCVWELYTEGYAELIDQFRFQARNRYSFDTGLSGNETVQQIHTCRSSKGETQFVVTWADQPYGISAIYERYIPQNLTNARVITAFRKSQIITPASGIGTIEKIIAYDIRSGVPSIQIKMKDNGQLRWLSVWQFLIDGGQELLQGYMDEWNTEHPPNKFPSINLQILQIHRFKHVESGREFLLEYCHRPNFLEWIKEDSIPFLRQNAVLIEQFVHRNAPVVQRETPTILMPQPTHIPSCQADVFQDDHNDREFVHFCGITRRRFIQSFSSTDTEKLAFVTLFPADSCDSWRSIQKSQHSDGKKAYFRDFNTYIKARLLSHDKRFGADYLYIFSLLTSKLQRAVQSNLAYVLKNTRAEEFDLEEIRQELISLKPGELPHHRLVSLVTRKIPPFPAYFVSHRWRLVNACAQRGPPHLFVTFTADEKVLIKRYPQIREEWCYFDHQDNPSEQDLANKNWSYLTVCVVKFLIAAMHRLISHLQGMGIDVEDTFYRFEFQKRGTPHIHALLWTPLLFKHLDVGSTTTDTMYHLPHVESLLCTRPVNDDQRRTQTHTHYARCRKDLKPFSLCKWGFPRLPMKSGLLLLPIEPCPKKRHAARKTVYRWQCQLTKWDVLHLDWHTWLEWIGVSDYDAYVRAIQQSLNRPQYFPRRTFEDTMINSFVSEVQSFTESNMDIQLIVTAEEASRYVTKYISKGEPGIRPPGETVLRATSFQTLMLKIQDLLSFRKITVQEAVFTLLGLPPCVSSWKVAYHNHCESFAPSGMLVPPSRARTARSLLLRVNKAHFYAMRPAALEDMVLYEFLMWWAPTPQTDERMAFPKSSGERAKYFFKQPKPLIICAPLAKHLPPEDEDLTICYYFLPWRSVDEVVTFGNLTEDSRQKAMEKAVTCRPHDPRWNITSLFYDSDLTACTSDGEQSETDEPELTEDLAAYFLQEHSTDNSSESSEGSSIVNLLSADLLPQMTASQLEFALIFQGWIRFRSAPLLLTCEGSGGTGKTFLIDYVTRVCREQEIIEGRHAFAQRKYIRPMMVKLAPTGTAAFQMEGETINHFFHIGLSNTIYGASIDQISDKLAHVDLMIIDEMSMISRCMLESIERRCRDLRANQSPFGGISVIMFGDFLQLEPVKTESWITSPVFQQFSRFELKESVRQHKDLELQEFLSHLRSCALPAKWINHIRSSTIKSTEICDFDTAIFMRNKHRNAFNKQKLETLGGRACNLKVIKPNKGYKRHYSRNTWKPVNFHWRLLPVKMGAKVMVVRNQNTRKGITNGSIGHIIGLRTGSERATASGKFLKVKHVVLKLLSGKKVRISRIHKFFPLDYAWGVTVWKAQGRTFQSPYVVDFENLETWRQLYVAVSRASHLSHIKFINFDEQIIPKLKASISPPKSAGLNLDPVYLVFMDAEKSSSRLESLVAAINSDQCGFSVLVTNFSVSHATRFLVGKTALFVAPNPRSNCTVTGTSSGVLLTCAVPKGSRSVFLSTKKPKCIAEDYIWLKRHRGTACRLVPTQIGPRSIQITVSLGEVITLISL